jgi:4-hydroxy-tetrahydrodipicolinate reductase
VKIAVNGIEGRMGQALAGLADVQRFEPASAEKPDVVIDFSSPEGTRNAAAWCAKNNVPLVTGTTGLDEEDYRAIDEAATSAPVVQSGNMSLGITLLQGLVAEAAQKLEGFDIEILETHHRHKKDSPSGTALLLGEAAARARGSALSEAARFGRHGRDDARKPGEIGFAVRRGGGVFGEHEVAFYSEGETVSLAHTALHREAFAKGALVAAQWVTDQPPGLYSMADVLGLKPGQ